jgi:Arc/MetJ-type ribon-helix-helix transcriptional regulator
MLEPVTQLVTRVDDDLVAEIDALVAAGVFASRSEAVRLGLVRLLDRHRRDEVGARIVASYLERPQDEHDVGWADQSTVRMIAEEPW